MDRRNIRKFFQSWIFKTLSLVEEARCAHGFSFSSFWCVFACKSYVKKRKIRELSPFSARIFACCRIYHLPRKSKKDSLYAHELDRCQFQYALHQAIGGRAFRSSDSANRFLVKETTNRHRSIMSMILTSYAFERNVLEKERREGHLVPFIPKKYQQDIAWRLRSLDLVMATILSTLIKADMSPLNFISLTWKLIEGQVTPFNHVYGRCNICSSESSLCSYTDRLLIFEISKHVV